MQRADRIRQLLEDAFQPQMLEIEDQSARHAGHAGARPGGETHYHVVIAASALAAMNRVAAHRAVMAALKEEFGAGLHALSVEIKIL